MRILIIEDNKALARSIKSALSDDFTVDLAYTGEDGLRRIGTVNYDLIWLDLILPDQSGLEVCRQLRSEGVTAPILVITATPDPGQVVTLLDAGADDYLAKPFEMEEVKARIRALLRRDPRTVKANRLAAKNVVLDSFSRSVRCHNQPVRLRRKEFELLEYLLRHKGRVVTRTMLLQDLWDDESPVTNVVDVHISYLRREIEKPFGASLIQTVPGVGYMIPS